MVRALHGESMTGRAGTNSTDSWNIWPFRVTLLLMSKVVSQNPDILGGEPVFVGTRVPVKSLFDHLEAGDSIEEFLEGFPSVKREQVIALLEAAREHALAAS